MGRVRVTISLLCLAAAFVAGSARALHQHRSAGDLLSDVRDLYHATAIADLPESWPGAAEDARIDIYGNAIEHAVADYRVDGAGQPYEAHSPDTGVAAPGAAVM
jgi:hypothetical protein